MTCTKMAFPSRKEALSHIRTAKAFRKTNNARYENNKMFVYLCQFCGLYHLTSKSKKEQRKIRKAIREKLSGNEC